MNTQVYCCTDAGQSTRERNDPTRGAQISGEEHSKVIGTQEGTQSRGDNSRSVFEQGDYIEHKLDFVVNGGGEANPENMRETTHIKMVAGREQYYQRGGSPHTSSQRGAKY